MIMLFSRQRSIRVPWSLLTPAQPVFNTRGFSQLTTLPFLRSARQATSRHILPSKHSMTTQLTNSPARNQAITRLREIVGDGGVGDKWDEAWFDQKVPKTVTMAHEVSTIGKRTLRPGIVETFSPQFESFASLIRVARYCKLYLRRRAF
jgi:hypothetical protein